MTCREYFTGNAEINKLATKYRCERNVFIARYQSVIWAVYTEVDT